MLVLFDLVTLPSLVATITVVFVLCAQVCFLATSDQRIYIYILCIQYLPRSEFSRIVVREERRVDDEEKRGIRPQESRAIPIKLST